MGEMFGVVRTAFPQLRTMTCAENLPLHDAAALKALNVTDIVVFAQCGGDHSFGPLQNRPTVFGCRLLDSWRQDGETSEETEKRAPRVPRVGDK